VSKQRLAALLHQLHVELSEADDIDESLGAQLRAATAEIRQVLERDEFDRTAAAPATGMIDQLRQAANRFEDSHPALTNTVGRVADALSQLGI
jgi:DNA repair ATPase RecN